MKGRMRLRDRREPPEPCRGQEAVDWTDLERHDEEGVDKRVLSLVQGPGRDLISLGWWS